jgi:putative membrane protein
MPAFKCSAILFGLLLTVPLHAREDKAAASSGDGVAVATVMAVNDHEIKAAEMAMTKDIGAPAKAYAKMMDEQHSENQTKTNALAAANKPVEDADLEALKEKTAAARAKLSKLDGKEFEKAYIDAMVKDHAEVLAKLDDKLIPGASDPKVVEHLKATRTHVAMHLEEARKLAK